MGLEEDGRGAGDVVAVERVCEHAAGGLLPTPPPPTDLPLQAPLGDACVALPGVSSSSSSISLSDSSRLSPAEPEHGHAQPLQGSIGAGRQLSARTA